jgi:hypothetical protein
MASKVGNFLKVILPKRRGNDTGVGFTNTFNPSQTDQVITAPVYREHLQDLVTTRQTSDSKTLLKELFKHDSDMSAAVHAYLTVANTKPLIVVRDLEGAIDRDGHKIVEQILTAMSRRFDYSKGYVAKYSLRAVSEAMRYMLLLRGGIAAELIVDKTFVPSSIRHIDIGTIRWVEPAPGQYVPIQEPKNSNEPIDLNIPTFFTSFYRKDPTDIYTHSPFVAAINTIAARQQVINSLYRIMNKVGFPRIEVEVIEEVLRKNAPADAKQDEDKMKTWLAGRLSEIQNAVSNLRPDQAFIHFDSVTPKTMGEGPKQSMDVTAVIEVLNAQNQAALKVMGTVIGRGESGVNTASVEAAIFAKSAEELNEPVGEILSQILTLALRLQGSESVVTVRYDKVDLRPEMELQPQITMKQSRLLDLLSEGLISDDDFHMWMFNRVRPDDIEEKSGTGFRTPDQGIDVDKVSPNADALGKSLSPKGSKSARSNGVKK